MVAGLPSFKRLNIDEFIVMGDVIWQTGKKTGALKVEPYKIDTLY